MADLCQQCSIAIYGEDSRDLANLRDSFGNYTIAVICEGCGETVVDNEGRCLLHDHDAIEAQIHSAIR